MTSPFDFSLTATTDDLKRLRTKITALNLELRSTEIEILLSIIYQTKTHSVKQFLAR